MLAPASPSRLATLASWPGRSARSMARRLRRPSRASSRVSTLASRRVSMLPPLSTSPTLRPANRSWLAHTAARPAAPAPSTTVFSIVMSRLTAASICGSETSRMSSTRRRTIGVGDLPRRLHGDALGQRVAAHRQARALDRRCTSTDRAPACTPITRRSGFRALAAIAMPEIRPPPPIGTTRVSISGAAPSISSAIGALAGDHQRVVVGMDEGRARARARTRARRPPPPPPSRRAG